MIDLLLYTGMLCTDAEDIIRRASAHDSISAAVQAEVVATVKEATPECNWDAND